MAVVLEADVIIRGEKGAFDLNGWLAARPDEHFELAAITLAELWHGVERADGAHRSRRMNYLKAIVGALPIIPYTENTAYEQAKIWARLAASGKMVGYYDLIVEANAHESDRDIA